MQNKNKNNSVEAFKASSDLSSDLKGPSRNLNVAHRIREKRKKLGLTQKALGKICDIDKNTIQGYEAGRYPRGDYAIKLAKALNCSIDWLLTGENYCFEDEEVSISNSKSDPEEEMSIEDMKLFNDLLREKLERVTNENKELRERLRRFEVLKKTGNSVG